MPPDLRPDVLSFVWPWQSAEALAKLVDFECQPLMDRVS